MCNSIYPHTKENIPLSALVLGLAFLAAYRASKAIEGTSTLCVWQWGMLGEPCQKQSGCEVLLLSPHSHLGISEERMKGLKLLGGFFWCEFISVLPQMCGTFLIGMSGKGRSHGRCTAVPVQPWFAERKGAESCSLRNCFIFWLMCESFIITALIRLITGTFLNKMCLRLLLESNTYLLTAPG